MSDTVTIADIYKLFERTEAQFAEFQKEADRRREEANLTMEELKKQVQETTKAVNSLITPLCLFIEEMVNRGKRLKLSMMLYFSLWVLLKVFNLFIKRM